MRPRALADVAAAAGGRLLVGGAERAEVRGVSIDSRLVAPGDLFVALPGEHADGHRYVGAALAGGAGGALVRGDAEIDEVVDRRRLVAVEDPARALLDLAREERAAFRGPVVGITGSTGKTCTKDFVAAVLRRRYRVVASRASFNNEVGVPLTILSATDETEALVCEMGSRGRGHILLLCDVARPNLGIVTNVGVAHMELFGSREALRDAKAELPEALPSDGWAVLNADDRVVRSYRQRTAARVMMYGLDEAADVRASGVEMDRRDGRVRFRLLTRAGQADVRLPVPGEHMVPNALAAAAAGLALGVPPDEAATGLAGADVTGGRMEVLRAANGLRVVNDAYNANPTSMAAALRAARWMAGDGRCIAVLGPMAELGPIEAEEHERVGELLARLGIDVLVAVGDRGRTIAVGAEREGVEPERIHRCRDAEEALRVVLRVARPGDLVLLKASRVARLDALAAALAGSALEVGEPAR